MKRCKPNRGHGPFSRNLENFTYGTVSLQIILMLHNKSATTTHVTPFGEGPETTKGSDK
jgi:hypothetical protein